MASTVADMLPRAKRLKLLREAKARKKCAGSKCEEAGMFDIAGAQTFENEPVQQEEEQPQVTTKTDEKLDHNGKSAQVQEADASTEDENDDDILNLAPKRANWDIERDIAPMLRKLERRTQHAIVEILREKLEAEPQEEGSDHDDEEEDNDEEETEEVDT